MGLCWTWQLTASHCSLSSTSCHVIVKWTIEWKNKSNSDMKCRMEISMFPIIEWEKRNISVGSSIFEIRSICVQNFTLRYRDEPKPLINFNLISRMSKLEFFYIHFHIFNLLYTRIGIFERTSKTKKKANKLNTHCAVYKIKKINGRRHAAPLLSLLQCLSIDKFLFSFSIFKCIFKK